ncbi:serpin family protein [Dapis sp. BLCC M229]|uniref:serpin family protein n=1 Tax=Dapis sp. BLCC M229 TaxID=3400188 RepID=UPI003CF39133
MFKKLVNKFSGISAKMSLGVIILIVILGVYNLPGSTIIFRNHKQHKLAQTVDKSTLNKLVYANNKFGFQLFSEIPKSPSNENIFISPISIAIALSMTYNGAAGKTQEAIAKTLNFQGMSLAEVNQANKDLGILLNSLNPEIKLNIANSIWTRKGISFYPSFLQVNQDFYQSQVREIDFNDPESPKIINNWVKDKTEGKIDEIIQALNPNDVMVLLNAIYFQGNWEEQFSEYFTQEMPFYLANGTQKQHPIMFQSSTYLYYYYENEDFQAVSLPYKKHLASMYIFLPREQVGLEGFYQVLNEENWEDWMKQFGGGYEVNLGLPKFKNESEYSTKEMPFYLANGTQKQHPIMFKESGYLYYENQDFQAVSLPYKKRRVSMYIFLPKPGVGLEKFHQVLNQKNWENWMKQFWFNQKQFRFNKINLGLPKFKNEYEVTLIDQEKKKILFNQSYLF